jgi:hypothetical protein
MSKRKATVKVAREYNWSTVYAVVKASSDRIVQEALRKFGVKP